MSYISDVRVTVFIILCLIVLLLTAWYVDTEQRYKVQNSVYMIFV